MAHRTALASREASLTEPPYRPAWWIPGAHLRTIWGKLFRRRLPLPTRRERWDTPDGDFVDMLRMDAPQGAPRFLLLHGLEGTPRSHYVSEILSRARQRGWATDLLLFRSCAGEPNRLARSYHSGETGDLDFVVRRLIETDPDRPLVITGVSLGGNVLLKWLGERGEQLPPQLRGAVAVSVPFDLARSARHINRGFARVYQWNFLRTLRRKALEKLQRFPDLLSASAIAAARSIHSFDHAVTAPLHGFDSADDYYAQSSSIRFLGRIRLPTLLLSARDDPFLPSDVLDDVRRIADTNPALHVEFVERGGHVGFIGGSVPWKPIYYAERRCVAFLAERLQRRVVSDRAPSAADSARARS